MAHKRIGAEKCVPLSSVLVFISCAVTVHWLVSATRKRLAMEMCAT